jgi:hypothetical protein
VPFGIDGGEGKLLSAQSSFCSGTAELNSDQACRADMAVCWTLSCHADPIAGVARCWALLQGLKGSVPPIARRPGTFGSPQWGNTSWIKGKPGLVIGNPNQALMVHWRNRAPGGVVNRSATKVIRRG